jgi:hypothetical protein
MDWKHILLILSVLIIVIVFYLQHGRMPSKFRREATNTEGMVGSMNTPIANKQRDGFTSKNTNTCNNSYSDPKNLPLREYYVKASFNTAYDGNDVSCSTIITRLAEGYRFIDFNVFSASGDVYVGFSQGNTPTLDSASLKLSDALQCIAKHAFVKPTTPPASAVSWDYTDLPLIISIRVFRSATSTVDVISSVANIINPTSGSTSSGKVSAPAYSSNYYLNEKNMPVQVDSCTPLSKISKKIIFTMNIENILEVYTPNAEFASNVPDATKTAANTFVNFYTGGHTCPAYYRYTDTSLTSRTNTLMKNNDDLNSYQTNVRYMMIVFPHPLDANVQPDVQLFALNCSVLLLPMRVYLGDDSGKLALNTFIFDYNKTAFVPASKLQLTINNYQSGEKSS